MSVVELSGLISDDYILYNRIVNMFYQKMDSMSLTGAINCNVSIDSMVLENTNNCRINILNKCLLNSNISLKIFLNTLIENLEFIPENTQKKIEKYMGVVLNSSVDQNNIGFMKRCNLYTNVSNSIRVKNLIIRNCYSKIPLNFDFYNTGDASANCGIIELLNAISKDDVDEEEKRYELESIFGLNLNDWFNFFIILCILTCVILIISSVTTYIPIKKIFIEKI